MAVIYSSQYTYTSLVRPTIIWYNFFSDSHYPSSHGYRESRLTVLRLLIFSWSWNSYTTLLMPLDMVSNEYLVTMISTGHCGL